MILKDFTQQTIISNPNQFIGKYNEVKGTLSDLLQIVQGLIIHADQGKLYNVSFSKHQLKEELLRTIPEMLKKIIQIDPNKLTIERPPNLRLIGMCRDYALLLLSFLRHNKIPARLRVGFANYFQSEILYEDHWLIEYFNYDQERWIRVDAQLDKIQIEYYNINFNTEDVPEDAGYLLGGQAWKLCRSGEHHPDDFGYNKNWKGWHSVKGNLLHDYNSLIGFELLPWDLWTDLSVKKYNNLTRSEKDLLDDLANLTTNPNTSKEDLIAFKNYLPSQYMESIYSKLKLYGISGQLTTTNPNLLENKFSIVKLKEKAISENPRIRNDQFLTIKGCRQNNLKNINVMIPKEKFTVITGVSGSGKSSLAFETIYAEGKRRYIDNMSNAIKMHEQIEKPDYDSIQGLSPTIAIEQKKGSHNPRSSVGTLTGIYDYLRMLFVSIGTTYCPYCGIQLKKENKSKNRCPVCNNLFQSLNISTFNANTHIGACHECNGLGYLYEVNSETIVIDDKLSILDGATSFYGKLRGKKPTGNWMIGEMYAIASDMKIDLELPWYRLPDDFKEALLYGTGEKIYIFNYISNGRDTKIHRPAMGAINHINRLFRESKTEDHPLKQYMQEIKCQSCQGELLCYEARYTTILGYRFPDLTQMPIEELATWVNNLPEMLSINQKEKTRDVLSEISKRVRNLMKVGLSYICLSRTAPSLSGGELQRVRLSSQLVSDLTGITYILDEPSIGLHPRDHHLIINTIKQLRDKGNTVIVVEHDKDTMLNADYIIDIGPGAGIYGGEIVVSGTVEEVKKHGFSVTGRFLKNNQTSQQPQRRKASQWISLKGCTSNNLKCIDVDFPLHSICTITGVSGSGKSSLIFDTFIPALKKSILRQRGLKQNYDSFEGYQQIDGYFQVDQNPIGKSTRSTIGTYIGVFDLIRLLFAKQIKSCELGLNESHFSYNSKEGACSACEGQGQIKISFQYMSDLYVCCPECKGYRYQEKILNICYKDKNISEVLNMEVCEAIDFFKKETDISQKLSVLDEVGLAYLKLGQSTNTLSGGESQRLKLAKELCGKQKKHMVYVLDEPTTGLHFQDIEKLILIFNKLVNLGHSVFIIEHNTEIINSSDWIIDIGPEGGIYGGQVVAQGTPEEIKKNPKSITGKYL